MSPPVLHSSAPNDPGLFIVFDGGEGCGKSTQAQLLRAHLDAARPARTPGGKGSGTVHVLRDPGTTRVGEMIRALLLNPDHTDIAMRCEMLLYMAARAQMMSEIILPKLAAGDTVICDRFISSTLAYQLGGEGLTEADIWTVGQVAVHGRWPDLVLILDMPVEHSRARIRREKDRIEQRPPEYHERVRRRYLEQARSMPDIYRVIAADRPPELVAADIAAVVEAVIPPRPA